MKKIILISILALFMVSGMAQADKVRINHSQVSSAAGIEQLANAIDTEADANRAATNLNSTLAGNIRDTLKGDYLLSLPSLQDNTFNADEPQCYTTTMVINGSMYGLGAQNIVLTPVTEITEKYYKTYAFDVGTNGTIDVNGSTTAAGYATYAADYAAVPALAADHVRLGYLTVRITSGTFTPATTSLTAANVQRAYTDVNSYISGMSSADAGTAVTEQVQRGK